MRALVGGHQIDACAHWISVSTTSAIDCLERLVFEITYYVSSGTLDPTPVSYTHLTLPTNREV